MHSIIILLLCVLVLFKSNVKVCISIWMSVVHINLGSDHLDLLAHAFFVSSFANWLNMFQKVLSHILRI